jgi:mono/diheme cytochrome c family protein
MLGVLGVLAVPGVLTPVAAHDPITTKVTFDREIRAILQARCVGCHAPGGPAPMPLTTYEEVRPWARTIKDQILTRRMPIWHAARGYGAFANDPSLTPAEMAIVAAWVDGGLPRGKTLDAATRTLPARGGRATALVPASAADATVRVTSGWISGWSFEPGDPLITSATMTSANGAPIGTWVAGDRAVSLPAGAGLAVTSPIHITLQRRAAADYEKPAPPRRSVLRLSPLEDAPPRRVRVEQAPCGAPRTGRTTDLLAVRPLLATGASARIWLERPGAQKLIVGWFREADARYPRTYWLARPADLPPESRVQSDVACTIELTLALR